MLATVFNSETLGALNPVPYVALALSSSETTYSAPNLKFVDSPTVS